MNRAITAREAQRQLDQAGRLSSLGLHEESLPHWQAAVAGFSETPNVQPQHSWVRALPGIRSIRRFSETLLNLEQTGARAIPRNPIKLAQAQGGLANELFLLHRFEESLPHYKLAVEGFLAVGETRPLTYAQFGWAFALSSIDRFEESLPHFEQASTGFAAIGENKALALTLFGWAEALRLLDARVEASLPHYARAADAFAALGDPYNLPRVHLGWAQALSSLHREEESLPRWRQSAEHFSDAGDVERLAKVHLGWAEALLYLRRFEETLTHYEQASEYFAALGDTEHVAHAQSGWAIALYGLDRAQECLPHHEKALEGFTSTGDREALAYTYFAAAHALASLERYSESLRYWADAAMLFDALGLSAQLMLTRFGWAESLGVLRRFQESLLLYEQAAESFTVDDMSQDLAAIHLGWAQALSALDREEESLPHFGRAAEGLASAEDVTDRAWAQLGWAQALYACRQFEDSLTHWAKAATDLAAVYDPNILAQAEFGWAETLHCLRREEDGLPHYDQAATFADGTGNYELHASALLGAARARGSLAFGHAPTSVIATAFTVTAVSALDAYERARSHLRFLPQRRRYQRNRLDPMESIATTALALSRHQLLWKLEQTIKGRTFQEEGAAIVLWRDILDAHPALREAEASVDQARLRIQMPQLNLVESLASTGRTAFSKSEEQANKARWRRQRLQAELTAAEERLNSLLDDLVREHPEILPMVTIDPPQVETLQEVLSPDEAYLGFLWLSVGLVRFQVTKPIGLRVEAVIGPSFQRLSQWLEGAHYKHQRTSLADWSLLDNPHETQKLLGTIPKGVRSLYVSPHGPQLTGLPMNRLTSTVDEDGHVVGLDKRLGSISIIPAAAILVQMSRAVPATPDHSYVGVACNATDDLPGVDREVADTAQRYFRNRRPPGEYFLTDRSDQFFTFQATAGVLHLACHAGPGGLWLRHGSGPTTPMELLRCQIKADIVVCTGCSAGRFLPEATNEFLGVIRQLLTVTGARVVVLSLDPVPDVEGVVFTDLLFGALTGQRPALSWGEDEPVGALSVGEALRLTRARMEHLTTGELLPFLQDLAVASNHVRDLGAGAHKPPTLDSAGLMWRDPWFVIGRPNVRLNEASIVA
jgi:tetratricopeptide (TPR) repeat protein